MSNDPTRTRGKQQETVIVCRTRGEANSELRLHPSAGASPSDWSSEPGTSAEGLLVEAAGDEEPDGYLEFYSVLKVGGKLTGCVIAKAAGLEDREAARRIGYVAQQGLCDQSSLGLGP